MKNAGLAVCLTALLGVGCNVYPGEFQRAMKLVSLTADCINMNPCGLQTLKAKYGQVGVFVSMGQPSKGMTHEMIQLTKRLDTQQSNKWKIFHLLPIKTPKHGK